jgi:hypothetical protein
LFDCRRLRGAEGLSRCPHAASVLDVVAKIYATAPLWAIALVAMGLANLFTLLIWPWLQRQIGSHHDGLAALPGQVRGSPHAALSPAQERLLWVLSEQQRRFAASKLIVNRQTGRLLFDNAPDRGEGTNLINDLYGTCDALHVSRFEALVESMPAEYLRLLH